MRVEVKVHVSANKQLIGLLEGTGRLTSSPVSSSSGCETTDLIFLAPSVCAFDFDDIAVLIMGVSVEAKCVEHKVNRGTEGGWSFTSGECYAGGG